VNASGSVSVRIANGTYRAMLLAKTGLGILTQTAYIDFDFHSEIGAAFSDGVPEAAKPRLTIFLGITGKDHQTAAAHQFIDPQVFKMTAVGQIYVFPAIVGKAEQFRQKII